MLENSVEAHAQARGRFLLPTLRSPLDLRYTSERRRVADEWVTQLLRQGDSQVFKKYSRMKLQMQREALSKLNRHANEMPELMAQQHVAEPQGFGTVLTQ